MTLVAVLTVPLRLHRTLRGLAALGLGSYGAWLVYKPAGYMTAALLLLVDLATDRPT